MNASKARFKALLGLSFYADWLPRSLNLPMRWRAKNSVAAKGVGGVNPWRHFSSDRSRYFVLVLTHNS